MISISALTEFSSDEDSDDEPLAEATKEAKESEAFALYNQALHEQRSTNYKQAENLYHRLLQSRFLSEVEAPEEDNEPLVDPAAILKYSAYKNLGNLALQRGDKKQAAEYLLEAVNLDSTDVSLWFKIGQVAVQLLHLPLANISFREGLRCNPNHWPCLDNVITVLYAISDYSSCLLYISKILEKDSKHIKAHAFKTQIFKEDAYLRKRAYGIFRNCSESVHDFRVRKQDIEKYVNEALKLRDERRKLAETPPLPVLKFQSPFKEFRWRHLGEQLIQLYDYINSCDPPITFGCRVDLTPCWQKETDSVDSLRKDSGAGDNPFNSSGESSVLQKVISSERAQGFSEHRTEGAVSSMETDEMMDRHSGGESGIVGTSNRGLMTSSDSQVHTDVSGAEMEEIHEKSRKSHKKKRGPASDPAPGKRRSARVRNTEKKKEVTESINYQELLQRFLPSTLLQSNLEEPADIFESPSAQPQRQSASARDLPDLPVTCDLAESEAQDVEEFLQKNEINSGVVPLMRKYVFSLSKQFHRNWPRKLSSVYIEVYRRFRKHITTPALFFKDQSDQYKRDLGMATLVYMELAVDKWRHSKPHEKCLGKFFKQDMVYVEDLSVMEILMKELWPQFPVRVYWMKAHNFVSEGKTSEAVNAYDVCCQLLDTFDLSEKVIHLPNIHQDKVITKEIVEAKKDSLRRTQSHEEILKLFEGGHYERVVDILRPVVDSPRMDGDDGEQFKQKLMLVEALLKVKDYKNMVTCLYKILKEYWEEMQGLEDFQTRTSRMNQVDKFFELFVRALSESSAFLRDVYQSVIIQLTHLIIDMIAWTMEHFDAPVEMMTPPPPPTVLHWAILFHIIKSEEDKLEEKKIPVAMETDSLSPNQRSDSPVPMLPSSIMLLDTSHEYLGRKSWCCNSTGALLKLSVKVLMAELENIPEDQTHPFAEDIQQSLEQCFYCLYGHPHKRAKAKRLQDHAVEEVPLTWEYGKCMFAYFKPKMLPEFDGYKTSSMSGDLENLFLRITKVIPLDHRPEDSIEKIQAYIDGVSDDVPTLPSKAYPSSLVVTEIFYLLADYYFKNKEFGKANKFYIHDICFCPNRLDSWAGLALAKSGRLELKLNSCDAKAEGGVYKQGMGSLRCFHRALEIDQSNHSLWIEYGSFAYILQSHASRQLKQQEQIQLSDESVEGLKIKQAEMLTLSEECFRKVNEMGGDEEGEEWLIHYMLGKISEKRMEVKNALEHYLEAMDHLHGDGAKFPKKISYHNPPDLALESLEMYFRIHAAVLKTLEREQSNMEAIDFAALEEILRKAGQKPFVKRQEKKLSEISSEHSTDVEPDILKLQPPPLIPTSRSNSPRYFMTPQDHDYIGRLYRRSQCSSQEDTPVDTASESDIFSGDESAITMETDLPQVSLPEPQSSILLSTNQESADLPERVSESEGLEKMEESNLGPDKSGDTPTGEGNAGTEAPSSEDKEDVREVEKMKDGVTDIEIAFERLVEHSIRAMHLCLQRFPQHYKSLYRIAHWHLTSKSQKNLQWCRDLLLGNVLPWQQMPHMPAPALFGEHSKTKNIFQGIWRIPIADIDRSGSFSWHMYRSVTLLIDVLEAMKDEAMLLQLATKLARTPEQGKKFLRDSDRPHLATRAYQTCHKLLSEKASDAASLDADGKLNLLMKIWQTTSLGQQLHLHIEGDIANKSLMDVFKALKGGSIEDEPSPLEQAVRFCQHQANLSKLPQTPVQSDVTKLGKSTFFGSPVRGQTSPGPGRSAEKVQTAPLSDRVQQKPSATPQGPPMDPEKSPPIQLGSSFLVRSLLAPEPDTKRISLGSKLAAGLRILQESSPSAGTKEPLVGPSATSKKLYSEDGRQLPSGDGASYLQSPARTTGDYFPNKQIGLPSKDPTSERGSSSVSSKMLGTETTDGSLNETDKMKVGTANLLAPGEGPLPTLTRTEGPENTTSDKAYVPGEMFSSTSELFNKVGAPTLDTLPSKPAPDLASHLDSLLQKVRAGISDANKSRWKKAFIGRDLSEKKPGKHSSRDSQKVKSSSEKGQEGPKMTSWKERTQSTSQVPLYRGMEKKSGVERGGGTSQSSDYWRKPGNPPTAEPSKKRPMTYSEILSSINRRRSDISGKGKDSHKKRKVFTAWKSRSPLSSQEAGTSSTSIVEKQLKLPGGSSAAFSSTIKSASVPLRGAPKGERSNKPQLTAGIQEKMSSGNKKMETGKAEDVDEVPLSQLKRYSPTEMVAKAEASTQKKGVKRDSQGSPSDNIPLSRLVKPGENSLLNVRTDPRGAHSSSPPVKIWKGESSQREVTKNICEPKDSPDFFSPGDIFDDSGDSCSQRDIFDESNSSLENMPLSNLQRSLDERPIEENIPLSNLQRSLDRPPIEENIPLSNLQRSLDRQPVEENMSLSNLQKSLDRPLVEENIPLSNLQRSLDIRPVEENVALSNLQRSLDRPPVKEDTQSFGDTSDDTQTQGERSHETTHLGDT